MTIRAGIALAALAAPLIAPNAAAAKATGGSAEAQLRAAQAEIALLKQQVEALQARMDRQDAALAERIDHQEATQAEAVSQAQAAQVKADQAIVQANAASSAAQAASTQTSKGGAFADAVKWAADTKITGRMYFNMSHVSAADSLGNSVERDSGFEFKRFYLGVDHNFDRTFSANVTMDIKEISGVGQAFYVKKAFLQAKFSPAFTVRLGSADMPWVPYVEGLGGYRHIEKELNDLNGFGTSADWGVHLLGSLADGHVSYQVSAIDGGGYRNPKLTKTIDLEGRIALEYNGFNAAIGGYTGRLGKDVEGASVYHTASRLNALLAYKGKIDTIPFTLGGEYFRATDWKQVTSVASDTSEGYSLFASVTPVDRWSIFGRYDWVTPSMDLNPLQKAKYYNVGVQYSPAKIVDLALVYKRDSAEGDLKTGNLATGQATRDEIGIYGQFRF